VPLWLIISLDHVRICQGTAENNTNGKSHLRPVTNLNFTTLEQQTGYDG